MLTVTEEKTLEKMTDNESSFFEKMRKRYSRCNPIWVKFIVYAIALLACGLVVSFVFWTSKRDCGYPYITNGMVIDNNVASHRTISLQCNVGYKLWFTNKSINENSYNLTCTHEGTWNDIIPACKIVDCEIPVPPTNGYIIGSTYTYGHSIMFGCSSGYKMWTADEITELKEALVLKCNEKGEWTGQFPICKAIECEPIDRGVNTILINYGLHHNYGDIVKYKCLAGYYLDRGDLKRTCREDGTWTGCEPVCRRFPSKSSNMKTSHYVFCLTFIVSLINFVKFNFD